jgi:hypothetical protein
LVYDEGQNPGILREGKGKMVNRYNGNRQFWILAAALLCGALLLVGCPVGLINLDSNLGRFSGNPNLGGSAIDQIRQAAGREVLNLELGSGQEEVRLNDQTDDLGTEGLVLMYKSDAGESNSTSPSHVTINGKGRVIDLVGAPTGAPLITVGKGVTLTLRDITLKGLKSGAPNDSRDNNAPLVLVKEGGTFIMENSVILMENFSDETVGGVQVQGGGAFTMYDGSIEGNTATLAGGVYVNAGMFIMHNGSISGNKASLGGGGGVHMTNGGAVFIMHNGTISGNKAPNPDRSGKGGGVFVHQGIFTMHSGHINNNEAADGGGVFVEEGIFILNVGSIDENMATGWKGGGGVYVDAVGRFTSLYGEIRGNVVTEKNSNGGGVYVGGDFSMTRGVISGNGIHPLDVDVAPASEKGNGKGCGVFVEKAATFQMAGGAISGAKIVDGTGWEGDTQNYYIWKLQNDTSSSHYPGQAEEEASWKDTPGGDERGYAVYFEGGYEGKFAINGTISNWPPAD